MSQTNPVQLDIQRVRPSAVLPYYAHDGDAGMDVVAAEEIVLAPGDIKAVPTGLILRIPRGYEVQIRPRSGLSLKTRLRLPNSPGTIDAGYRDELMILVENISNPVFGDAAEARYDVSEKQARHGTYTIRPGDRIAQMVLAPVTRAGIVEVSEISDYETGDRGGGFGSSGVTHSHYRRVKEAGE